MGLVGGIYNFYCNLYSFFITKSKRNTFIDLSLPEKREEYRQRIQKRIGLNVNNYSVMNIHKIGISTPPLFAFEELLKWDSDSCYWPNQIARVNRVDGGIDKIIIHLFGLKGLKPLFNMNSIRIQHEPMPDEPESPRYLLYKVSGGYPIGIFSLLVRSSMPGEGETEETQLFSLAAFNFYGRKNWFNEHILNPVWQKIHNRVSSNILNRMKKNFEKKFQEQFNTNEIQEKIIGNDSIMN